MTNFHITFSSNFKDNNSGSSGFNFEYNNGKLRIGAANYAVGQIWGSLNLDKIEPKFKLLEQEIIGSVSFFKKIESKSYHGYSSTGKKQYDNYPINSNKVSIPDKLNDLFTYFQIHTILFH